MADTQPMTVEELEARQTEIKGRRQELDKEFQGRAFSEEANTEWNALGEERDANEALIEEFTIRRQTIAEDSKDPQKRDEAPAFHTRRPGVTTGDDIWDLSTIRSIATSPEHAKEEMRDRSMRAIDDFKFPILENKKYRRITREDCQERIEHVMRSTQEETPGEVARHILMTGSPLYRRAFFKKALDASLNAEEQRALSLGALTGGQAVPVTLDATVLPTSNSVVNPARALGRVVTISGSNTWNGVTSGAITATRVAEVTASTDNAPTMAAPTATVTKAHAMVPYSIEVGGDWGALEAEMGRLLADAKDDDEGTQFVTGAGTTVFPQGFVTGTTATVAAASGLTITAANLYALEAALPPRFRGNEQFVAQRGIYNVVRGIDTGGGAALWLYLAEGLNTQAPTPGNTGALLLGRGAWEASAMQATVVNATKIMIVGDFSYFLIVDRLGLTVEFIPHMFDATTSFPTGQRGLYAYWRNTSKVLSSAAFVALTGTT